MSKCDHCGDDIKPGDRAATVDDCLFHAACACTVLGKEVARLRDENRSLRDLVNRVGARAAAASHGLFRVAR